MLKKKWGSSPEISCVCFDRDGALTTTFGGMKSVADQYFVDKGYRRLFTSRGDSNGTEKIERYFRSLKAGVRAELLESGFTDYMWFDAAHVFGVHYNQLPIKANRVSEIDSPFESLGIKVNRRDMCLFGSFGSRLDKRRGDLTAAELPGLPCIFIGYGTDTPGKRVIVPDGSQLRIEVDKDVVISSNRMLTKAFVRECRTNPMYAFLLPWVDLVFRPFDIVDILPALSSPPAVGPKHGDFGFNFDSKSEDSPSVDEPVVCPFSYEDLQYMGYPVAKKFDGVIFHGQVLSIDHDDNNGRVIYGIKYEDDDTEDVYLDELKVVINNS